MVFHMPHLAKNKESSWVDAVFYCISALLLALLFSYAIFGIKTYLDTQKINELDGKIAALDSLQQKEKEKKVLDYKKKIDDYYLLIGSHKITSNIFAFIEKKTMPNVWFSNFDISLPANEVKLSGESENMETLSRQIKAFEESGDYINSITVLNSEVQPSRKVKFTLSFHLNQKAFNYTVNSFSYLESQVKSQKSNP